MARGAHSLKYDAVHDEIIIPNPHTQAILTFRGNADGEEAPIRVLRGPSTQMRDNVDRVEVDGVHNEIFIANMDSVLVLPREANGDAAPIRILKGPNTRLTATRPFLTKSLAVDPVNNLLIVGTNPDTVRATMVNSPQKPGAILIFNRTDNGDVKPRGVIYGPKTGIYSVDQIQVYPSKGWIVATIIGNANIDLEAPPDSSISIWSIDDNGDVPPRWKIGGPKSTLKKPRGVALDPKHKELIVADMRLNALLTYYFPEMF